MPQHAITLVSPSGRVRLVPPSAEDDEAVAMMRAHPETLRYLRFLPTTVTVEDARDRRTSRENNPQIVDFHVHAMDDNGAITFAGTAGIFNIDLAHSSCEAGIAMAPAVFRKGYATEALYVLLKHTFEDRKVHRVTFETSEDNVRMRSWLERVLGAHQEALRREAWKESEGHYRNVQSYSLLEGEWSGHAKTKLEEYMTSRTD